MEPPRATITLSRPEALNAQTPRTWEALAAIGSALDQEALDDDIRAVVVRGEGRAFSAGLDRRMFSGEDVDGMLGIGHLAALPDEQADATIARFQEGFAWLRDPRWLTVAAVQGQAVGGGFQLALACDLRVLADDAQLRMAETMLGIVPDLGGTLPLVQYVGYPVAVDICLSGRAVGAQEALRLGLAIAVVPREELDGHVHELVTRLLAAPAGAVRETLGLLRAAAEDPEPANQFRREREAQLRRLRELAAHR